MAKAKQVIQDAEGIWLAAPLAATRCGLTKPELERRALAGELAFKGDNFERPRWYLEPEISKLASKLAQQKSAKLAKPKRPPTTKQLEARYKKEAEELRKTSRQFQGGPLLAHGNKVTIAEIFAKAANKKAADDKGGT